MKRFMIVAACMVLTLSLAACGNRSAPQDDVRDALPQEEISSADQSQEEDADSGTGSSAEESQAGNILVAYFAYSENMGDTSGMGVDAVTSASLNKNTVNTEGNLQVMAQEISEKKGAEVFSILLQESFDPDYSTMLDGAIEQIQSGTLPPLQSQIENIEQYDVVFLGTPVWSGELPPAVRTFLTENDLSGKTIVPFGIHLGSRFGRMIDQIKELCPDAEVMEGFTVNAGTANNEVREEFSEWLDSLQIE
ncbi:MAG: NAD(P)H-dependent oxidoreductase [Acetatifactor muris]|nr:NAD(P)H-dependent oxidoreductase [Acetatifactor muris]